MHHLTSTSDVLRLVTGSAVSTIGAHVDWAEYDGSSVTPGATNTPITTAATTTIVAAPASSKQRRIKDLVISNNHATASNLITVQHYNGTDAVDLFKCTLLAGERLVRAEGGRWAHQTAWGGEYAPAPRPYLGLGITGTLAETMRREECPEANNAALTSGTLRLQAIWLNAGTVVSNISVHSATTAAGTPTNWWFALYGALPYTQYPLLAVSANQTTTAWAANTLKTLAMGTAYTVPKSGYYYIGVMVAATTVPTLKGSSSRTNGQLTADRPILQGNSSTGLTTTAPNPAAALSALATTGFWAAVT